MDECAEFVCGDVEGVVFQRVIAGTDQDAFGFDEAVYE